MKSASLARNAYRVSQRDAATIESVDRNTSALKLPLSGIQSTLGRILRRAHEAQWAVGAYFFDRLMTNLKTATATANTEKWEPASWPQHCCGIGFTEVLGERWGHWASIRDQKIELYQCVVPTTEQTPARAILKQIGALRSGIDGERKWRHSPISTVKILRTLHS